MEDRPTKVPIRVILADDHTMFRQGLKEMLSTDEYIKVVGEAMDRLLRLSPPPKIVVVTMHDDPRLVRELLGRGARAYLVKSASLEELLTAVHAAAESPAEPHDENVVIVVPRGAFEKAEKAMKDGGLSARELEILLLAARGLSNRQIAHSLRLAEATVKRHLANLYPKMGVGSRGEATSKALAEGWISARDVTRTGEQR